MTKEQSHQKSGKPHTPHTRIFPGLVPGPTEGAASSSDKKAEHPVGPGTAPGEMGFREESGQRRSTPFGEAGFGSAISKLKPCRRPGVNAE